MHLTTVLLFALATFLLTVSPGPGVLYVTARSLAQGRRAGFASMFGIEFGEVVWIAAAATGVAALLSASVTALDALRFGCRLPRLPGHPALATGRRGDGAVARAARQDLPPGFRDAASQPEGRGVLRRVPAPVLEHLAGNRASGHGAGHRLHRDRDRGRCGVRACRGGG